MFLISHIYVVDSLSFHIMCSAFVRILCKDDKFHLFVEYALQNILYQSGSQLAFVVASHFFTFLS